MNTITIEELMKQKPETITVLDVRPADEYRRGTFDGAISMPMKEIPERKEEIPKDKPVYLLCHTGERSMEYVDYLEPVSYTHLIVIGGGYDKHVTFDDWIACFGDKVKWLVLLGQTANQIAETAKKHGFTHIVFTESLEEDVYKRQ